MRWSPLRLLWLLAVACIGLAAVQFVRRPRALTRELLKRDHRFVSADDGHFHYNGRWIAVGRQRRRDTSFPGARLDLALANVSSAYLQLRNENGRKTTTTKEQALNTHRLAIFAGGDETTPPSAPVSLRVDFPDRALRFDSNAHGTIALISGSQTPINTTVRIVLAAAPSGTTLELDGLWLSNGAYLQDSPSPARKALIEVVTSSSSPPAPMAPAYTSVLAASLNMSHHSHLQLPYCLTPRTCPSDQPTLHKAFFRSGLPLTAHFSLPYDFPSPPPSVLILDLGIQDYAHFLYGNSSSGGYSPPSTRSITQFNLRFIQAYVRLIKSIREDGYSKQSQPQSPSSGGEFDPDQDHAGEGTLNPDAIWLYNSAPSTVPIVLLTPFTPDRVVRRLLSHALAQVVRRVRREHGDTSTRWLDTAGWVDRDDFHHHHHHHHHNQTVSVLTAHAHVKIAALLAAELWSYADAAVVAAPYTGNLVVPELVDMDILLQERKVNLLKTLVDYRYSAT